MDVRKRPSGLVRIVICGWWSIERSGANCLFGLAAYMSVCVCDCSLYSVFSLQCQCISFSCRSPINHRLLATGHTALSSMDFVTSLPKCLSICESCCFWRHARYNNNKKKTTSSRKPERDYVNIFENADHLMELSVLIQCE